MFDEKFEVFLADDAASKVIHFNIRYQVYCEDKKFEDPSQFPDSLERDEYDDKDAVHFIVKDKENGKWVAAMRLIVNENCQLPVTHKCELNPDFDVIGQRVIEISRLCVLNEYRGAVRANGDKKRLDVARAVKDNVLEMPCAETKKNKGQEIFMSLIRTAYQYGQHNQVYFGVALMTRPLARMLRFIGLNVNPAGSSCEFNGTRYPFRFDLLNVVSDLIRMPPKMQQFFVAGPVYQLHSERCAISDESRSVASFR